MKYTLILFYLLLFSPASFCQGGNLSDTLTLQKNLEKTEGNEKVLLYVQLAKVYQNSNLKSAILSAKKGLDLAEKLNYDLGIAESNAALGDFYVMKDNLEVSKKYYEKALDKFQVCEKHFDYAQILMILGNIHLVQNNYIESLKKYQNSLDVAKKYDLKKLIPYLTNNIGAVYLEIENNDQAYIYFKKARLAFKEIKDEFNEGLALSNCAEILHRKGKYDEAINLFLDAIKIYTKKESWSDIAMAYNNLSLVYYSKGKITKAREFNNLAISTLKNKTEQFQGPSSFNEGKIYNTTAFLSYQEGDLKAALKYALESNTLSNANEYKKLSMDNAKLLSDIYTDWNQADSALKYLNKYVGYYTEILGEQNSKQLIQLSLQYEFDAMLQQKELANVKKEAKHQRKELTYLVILICFVFLGLILVLLFINQKNKTIKSELIKENLELEKISLNQKLNYKNKELATNMMYLLEKNEFITIVARKLSELKSDVKRSNEDFIQQLINELRQNSSTKIWEEFETRFKEVHSDFYDALNNAFPDLSPNEKKICAFLRLNMSSKEISAITYQSVKSINMARFRLRKKMDMERDENLIAFLSQL